MKKFAAVSFVSSFLLLNACATHTAAVATPVNLTIASKTASRGFVSDVRDATLKAIQANVPSARPLTVAVNLDVAYDTTTTPFYVATPSNNQRVLPTAGYNASQTGSLPTVPVNESAFFTSTASAVAAVRLSYTITDANGHIIESQKVKLGDSFADASPHIDGLPLGFHGGDPFVVRQELIQGAATFLASRVAAVNR